MSRTINLTQAAIQPEDVKKAKETPVRDFLRSQVAFFYLVLLIFIVVSVTESGDFFNKAITHNAFNGILGYAVATVFDLFSLVCMIARMNASRIADKRGMFLSLVGVIVCAGASAFANVSSAVQDYQVSQFSNIPGWMQQVSPYLGMVFPGMVIVVTLIADHIGDLNPQKADSVTNYRAKEMKKVELLRVRYEIEKQRFEVQRDIALLHQKPSKKTEKMRQEYAKNITDLQSRHDKFVTDLRANYDAKIKELSEQIATLKSQIDATSKTTTGTTQDNKKEQDTEPLHVVRSGAKKTTRNTTPRNDFPAKVAAYQQRHPDLTLAQVAQHFNVSVRTIQRRLGATA